VPVSRVFLLVDGRSVQKKIGAHCIDLDWPWLHFT
jgi:hypothetical protein